MTEPAKRIAVVTPVHNRREITLQCLRSLERIDSAGLDVSVFVVDDGSTDGTAEAIAAEFPGVYVLPGNGDLWFTEGTNVGVRAALEHDPDYVLMMNDDQVFDPGFLQSMVRTAVEYPRSIVGGLLLLWDTPHRVFQVAPQWKVAWGGWRHWFHQTVWTVPPTPWDVDLIVGNCVLVPVAAIREHGLMRSDRYPNFGDAEYTPRLKRNGWRLLIDPGARVFCQPNNIPAKVTKMSLRQKLNALVFDLGNIHNLRRRFYFYWDSAPSKAEAVSAYFVFFGRVMLGRNYEGDWGSLQHEPPLKASTEAAPKH
jgi:GT2 family glycosyltransferase